MNDTFLKKVRQALLILRIALADGLGIVTRIWEYKTRSWVTCIATVDVDGDGDVEIIAGTREGRLYCLYRTGKLRWKRDIGTRAWIVTLAISGTAVPGYENAVRILIGTRDGKVYVLDGEGKLVTSDGRKLSFDGEGKPLEAQQAPEAYWFSIEHAIRSIYVASEQPSHIILGAEDRCIYALNFQTGEMLWKRETRGWVRTVFVCDLNRDGKSEVLAGSADGNLYLLNMQGDLLLQHTVGHPIRTTFVDDVDKDGTLEILLATNHKDLIALTYGESGFKQKWQQESFNNRLLSLYASDIDADGNKEIIAGCDDKHLYILDAVGKTIWRHNHKFRIFDIAMLDIDNDSLPELLLGGEHKRVRAMHIRLRTGVIESIRQASHRVEKLEPTAFSQLNVEEQLLLQDVIGPNRDELVTFDQAKEYMKTGSLDMALSTLLKLEQQKVELLWRKSNIEYIRTVCFRHTRKRRMGREIIIGTADGRIHAFYANGQRVWTVPLNEHIVDVQTAFLDHQKKEEIVICSSGYSLYILGGDKHPVPQTPETDTWVSSICVRATGNLEAPEIIIGTEDKKLSIYDRDLQKRKTEIQTKEGVRLVRATSATEEDAPEIMVAGLSNHLYAYTREGNFLWAYQTHDHIKAVCIKDINGDGHTEILVGSEDSNIHVLDSSGHLLWRYFLPHSVLTIDVAPTGKDGTFEIFAGCADGYLYVFNRDGDLCWTYQAKDRIHAVRIEDINGDGNIEIALGSEDEFELLSIINQQQVAEEMRYCWTQLCQQTSLQEAIALLLESDDPFLQVFALDRLLEQETLRPSDFDLFDDLATKGAPKVRKALARHIPTLYRFNPVTAHVLLRQLWSDLDYEVRNVVIDRLPTLMKSDWDEGFSYLRLAVENSSRFVRRIAVRKMDELIRSLPEVLADRERRHQIFSLLLIAAQDKDSEWVRQETAQVLAHYLDRQWGNFIVCIHLFIVKNLQPSVWEIIAYKTTSPVVRDYINAVIPLLSGLDESSAQEKLNNMTQVQSALGQLRYGDDLHLIYGELYHLFTLNTLEDISHYQCELQQDQFHSNNQFARNILPVFQELNKISRPLKMYFRREALQDRLNSLLEALEAVEQTVPKAKRQYSIILLGELMSKLPDYQIFLLLLNKWKRLIQNQLNELRGKAELKVSLLAKEMRKEEQVGILVAIKNVGRSSASGVQLTLLHSKHFELVGRHTFETEVIAAGEESIAEFVLRPHPVVLDLKFEVVFENSDGKIAFEEIEDCIKLRDWYQEFRPIPNPYSTGTPTYDSDLFYGRERDMAVLLDNLTRKVKSVVVLYGQRRSGKTSLLVQLANSSNLGEHIAVLLDMQAVSYHGSIENVLRRIAHSIEQALKKKDLSITAPELDDFFTDDPIHTFNIFLNKIEKLLSGRKLILLIDEFEVLEEQVNKGQLKPEIFEYLRDIVQHRQNINFLFSGTHKITEHTQWYHSVFFNMALHHRLTRLPAEAAKALIQKPVAGYLDYEPLTIQKIRWLTADQPYLIHLMCRALVDYCNAHFRTYVTINDVNIVHDQVMGTSRHHFEWLWNQIKPEERTILAAIAERSKEDGRWLSLTEIEECYSNYDIPYRKDHILDTLKTLIEADIIEAEQENFRKSRIRIPVGLTRSWLLREHPVEVACKELTE